MGRLTWDAIGGRNYEIGVDHGVFYPFEGGIYTGGIAWNGLTGVEDDNGGRDASPLYSGGVKVGSEYTSEEYSGSIKCYTFPDEFEEYLGERELTPGIYARQQDRDQFGFCYRSKVGNDTEGTDHGYRIHMIYNMRVTDFSRAYSTVNESMDIQETSISFETFPQEVDDEEFDPVSEIVIDSTSLDPDVLNTLEEIIYGTDDDAPRLPFPDEIIELTTPKQEMPEDWVGFPHLLQYPMDAFYPRTPDISTLTRTMRVGPITIPAGEGYGRVDVYSEPIIPLSAIIVSVEASGVPDAYTSVLEATANLSENRMSLGIMVTNTSDAPVTVSEAFVVTATIRYIETEGE